MIHKEKGGEDWEEEQKKKKNKLQNKLYMQQADKQIQPFLEQESKKKREREEESTESQSSKEKKTSSSTHINNLKRRIPHLHMSPIRILKKNPPKNEKKKQKKKHEIRTVYIGKSG